MPALRQVPPQALHCAHWLLHNPSPWSRSANGGGRHGGFGGKGIPEEIFLGVQLSALTHISNPKPWSRKLVSVAHPRDLNFHLSYLMWPNECPWLSKHRIPRPVSGEYGNVFGVIQCSWQLEIDDYGTHKASRRLENCFEVFITVYLGYNKATTIN